MKVMSGYRCSLLFDGWVSGISLASRRFATAGLRLETLTEQLGRTVLLSRAFADFVESDFDLERIGEYPVRGFNDPIELFAYHGWMPIYRQVPSRPQGARTRQTATTSECRFPWLLVRDLNPRIWAERNLKHCEMTNVTLDYQMSRWNFIGNALGMRGFDNLVVVAVGKPNEKIYGD
jgi:hypothetical protein